MDKSGIIYLLHDDTDESAHVYVGKSINPAMRLKAHLTESRLSKNTPKNDWLRSLLKKGREPSLVTLEATVDWEEAERFYIAYFRSIGVPLLNYTDGGEGLHGATLTTRAKMSAAKRGKQMSSEQRKKISATLVGIKRGPRTPEHTAKIVAARPSRTGIPLSPLHRAAISEGRKGLRFTEQHRKNLSVAQQKRHARQGLKNG